MVKVISLSDEAYTRLKSLKRDRSFSEVVVELVDNKGKKRKDIVKFIGLWKDDGDYWNNFKKEIKKSRNSSKMREVNL